MNSTPSSLAGTASGRARRIVRVGASLVLGLMAGLFLHYLIYRLSLPTEPFIYVSF
jgi:hypothetical protein